MLDREVYRAAISRDAITLCVRIAGESSLVESALSGLGRFAEPSLFMLVSLGEAPKDGSRIASDVEALTGRRVGPGTLYGAIARLERRGLIEPLEAEDRRRPYRLTRLGATTLAPRLDRLRSFVQTGLTRAGRTSMNRAERVP